MIEPIYIRANGGNIEIHRDRTFEDGGVPDVCIFPDLRMCIGSNSDYWCSVGSVDARRFAAMTIFAAAYSSSQNAFESGLALLQQQSGISRPCVRNIDVPVEFVVCEGDRILEGKNA